MDKTILKNFAIYARNKLIQEIKNKASMIGIRENGIQPFLPESTLDMLAFDIKAVETYKIYNEEVKQYKRLIEELNKRKDSENYNIAYSSLIEEVAYTWFNRLIAIRFMEVNNYLPDKMRVLSSGRQGVNEPEFLTNYLDTSLSFMEKELEQLSNWKMDGSNIAMENMFHLLFIKQCNALNKNLPDLFEETDDYAELLLTISYNDPDGVLYKLIHDIPEEYFDIETEDGNGQVEIIGWMYQYYNTERKDEVFSKLKLQKIGKEDIPAATQLFTPDWIVRYLVENSLGRLWIERLIANGDKREEKKIAKEFGWKYYIPEAEQSNDVKEQLTEIRDDKKDIKLEDIRFIDPAMGSFHIGVYAFDIFMQLYESQGYTSIDAAKSIIENNLYGVDIDKRAYQLSYFACMMKGRQYNRRILSGEIKSNLYSIIESNNINRNHLNYVGNNFSDKKIWDKFKDEITEILDIFKDAKEYGSILQIPNKYDYKALKDFIKNIKPDKQISFETIGIEKTKRETLSILSIAKILSQKYDIVVTNPPYMGKKNLNAKLSKYMDDNYPKGKSELYSSFILKCMDMTQHKGFTAMITIHTWMFISSFENLRRYILNNGTISSMLHTGPATFDELNSFNVLATSFCFRKANIRNYNTTYIRLVDFLNLNDKLGNFGNHENIYYLKQEEFGNIPGSPLVYWVSENARNNFKGIRTIRDFSEPRVGLQTGDNNKFVRSWYEVSLSKCCFDADSNQAANDSNYMWFPYNKGGNFRKWYGMNEYVINWKNGGIELSNFKRAILRNSSYYFKEGITWSLFGFENFGVRYKDKGFIFDVSGSSIFPTQNTMLYTLAFLASKVAFMYLSILAPTVNFQAGNIGDLPLNFDNFVKDEIDDLAQECIDISRSDWNDFEESWQFARHPLCKKDSISLESTYRGWEALSNARYNKLKANEERINTLFINVYNLNNDITAEVVDRDIALRRANLTRDIKSFISYAVGCIFGRYSLDIEGLVYAGGDFNEKLKIENEEWKIKNEGYWLDSSIHISKDNILLITDEEYFEDDIFNRFIEFVRVAYGKETLDENLQFIGDALGGKGSPKDIIRNYFIKDFYNDHVKTYQKRPIYWLYDSGKLNGFKALIYMHRYNEDTTGKLRIDYLHKMQKAYERKIDNLKYDIGNSKDPREVAVAEKSFTKITKQLKECKDYDEKIAHLALARIPIDLDDGVKVNYDKIQTDENRKNLKILAKI